MSGLNIGMSHGDHSPLARRVEDIERFLQGYQNTLIGGRDTAGFPMLFPVLAGAGTPDGQVFKPFPFALDRHVDGASIYYGQLLVAICQSALSMTGVWEWNSETEEYEYKDQLRVTQQEIPNPMIYVPVNLDTEDLLKPTKLDWFGDVFLQWKCDENAVMNPEEVKIVGPTTPTAVPIPAYENAIPTDPTECLYFIKIGNVPEEGDITQNHASDVFWQPQLIRGGGTGF